MKKIPLTQGKFALVDDEDYEWLMQWKWCAARIYNKFYARRGSKRNEGRKGVVMMHRVLMDAPARRMVDHIDGDGLNNQKSNLRICVNAENQRNSGVRRNNTSGFKGICKIKRNIPNPWMAMIGVDNKIVYLGLHSSPEMAARAYDRAALKYHGEFARLNFPQKQEKTA